MTQIYTTIIHFSDSRFLKNDFDVLLCSKLSEKTNGISYFLKSYYKDGVTVEDVYRNAYNVIKGTPESYLVMCDFGLSDILRDKTNWDVVEKQLEEIVKMAKCFNKQIFSCAAKYNFFEGKKKYLENNNIYNMILQKVFENVLNIDNTSISRDNYFLEEVSEYIVKLHS